MNKTLKELSKKHKESMKRKNKIPNGLEALDNLRDYGEWLPSLEMGIIRRELRALEIIKKKELDFHNFRNSETCERYNCYAHYLGYKGNLTQEEFDLLKEVLI